MTVTHVLMKTVYKLKKNRVDDVDLGLKSKNWRGNNIIIGGLGIGVSALLRFHSLGP